MKKIIFAVVAVCGLGIWGGLTQPAQADCGLGGYMGGLGWGPRVSAYMGSPYAVPYYALHPPVYYSYAIPRTFGYSPFPYPGTYRTPEVEESTAEVILNPHVDAPKAEPKPMKLQTVSAPLEVLNPYVTAPGDDSATRYTQAD